MKRGLMMLLLGLAWPGPAAAQDLTGSYVHQSPRGPVTLALQQDAHGGLAGEMKGADGDVARLQGTLQAGRATGSIATADGIGWFAAGFIGDTLTLLVAELDPATGQPDLERGWRLGFARTPHVAGSAPEPSPAGAGPTGPAAERSPARYAAEISPQVQEWLQFLRGKRVTFISRGGGDGGGWQQRADYLLCSDGTLQHRESSSVAAEVPGAIGHGGGRSSGQGRWRIAERTGHVFIEYQMADGTTGTAALAFHDGGTYIDGTRAYVTNQNDVCP